MMDPSPARLKDLEALFVREFRACQAMLTLSLNEQSALSQDDVAALLQISAEKESRLDDLAWLEKAKFSALSDLGITVDPTSGLLHTMKLINDLADVDRDAAGRLLHIQEGTQVLIGQVRDITLVNRALAASALERASCMQAQLLSLYRSHLDERHELNNGLRELVGTPVIDPVEFAASHNGQTALPAIFAAIIDARDALNQDMPGAISSAVGNLQNALEGINGFLELDAVPGNVEGLAIKFLQEKCGSREMQFNRNPASLVEMIANLYHQENAYQTSLKTSNRMLALV